MIIGHTQAVFSPARTDVAAGSAFELLVALAGASAAARNALDPELREALDAVGDTAGESWLNLLGISLDLGPPYDATRLGDAVEQMDPVDIRRHLLGGYAWSWCTLAGADTIDAAASGDRAAGRKLLAHQRYYAGRARDSLSVLLPLDPAETRDRLAHALSVGLRHLIEPRDDLDAALDTAVDAASASLAEDTLDAIEHVTEGYRYVPEPEAERVLLIPHLQPEPWLVLAQHRTARLIVYQARVARGAEERVAALGRALADAKRVEILSFVARGVDRVAELVAQTGLARSTVHHHLAELRDARLIDLEGNARAYRYLPRREALQEAHKLLSEVLPRR
ncbi:MAG: ArsR/SmtB family transcription factor [Gaiellaceae bacterium]